MSLKTLISLKFVLYVITFLSLAYLSGNLTDSYRTLEKQNKILIEQKKYYSEIIKLDAEDLKRKKELLDIVNVTNSKLELESKKSKFSLETNIWILLISFIIIHNVFNYLNTKIEKLKSLENESEREQML